MLLAERLHLLGVVRHRGIGHFQLQLAVTGLYLFKFIYQFHPLHHPM
ncbi:hypothetical protein SDC9_190725 [bioreactor metagenome]|uniref:Uncharacterized protein n=1 Tax=bioreactor metagenome TaxID=1076179 RepID=A0A645HX53_9ZZZZ